MLKGLSISGLFLLVLLLFGCSTMQEEQDGYSLYEVRPGDTLYKIGQSYNVSARELMRVNHVADPRRLMIGQVLRIPTSSGDYSGQAASFFGSSRSRGRSPKSVRLGRSADYVGSLGWPLNRGAGRLSSGFGYRSGSFHEGVDIRAEEGTPILAAHSGKVVYCGRGISGYGNIVVLKGNSILTVYAHNRRNTVRKGQRVLKGTQIAEVGASGNATGFHLHFETRIPTSDGYLAVDPRAFF